MNYRHIFHAGNRCDVVKHSVQTLILAHLRSKDKGFMVLDTHAGVGLYDLADPRAQKTQEASEGIQNLITAELSLPQLTDYMSALKRFNPLWDKTIPHELRVYPGSPLLAFHMLRPQDRLEACELHPEDAESLRLYSPADNRLHIHRRDGYEALNAFLPPAEKRGLVFIDPPFEQVDEFDILIKHIAAAHKRWPSGIYMLWYPVKDRPTIWDFHEKLAETGIPKILCAEFIYHPETRSDRLNGSGLILINPPWQMDNELISLFPLLHKAMRTQHSGDSIKWLVP